MSVITCGVKLLSTNQQLSWALPSLHVETVNEKNVFVSVKTQILVSLLILVVCFTALHKSGEKTGIVQNQTTRSNEPLPVVLEPLPHPRPANRGPPPDQGEGDGCFWLPNPGGGRESWFWLLPRLAFQDLCPVGSGGQLVFRSTYFAKGWQRLV